MSHEHNHAEAFCLMHYASADGKVCELFWNSRDGVTPYCMRSTENVEMFHVGRDSYAPDYKPPSGMRIFIGLTMERAREIALKRRNQAPDMAVEYAESQGLTLDEWTENLAVTIWRNGTEVDVAVTP